MSITRRTFLMGAAALPTAASARIRRKERLRVVAVGAGGQASFDIAEVAKTGMADIVALCDVDAQRAADSFKRYPDAKKYTDWRKMFDAEKDFDAVTVAIADHNHAIASCLAMKMGKHVYCEKPLGHSVWEVR